MDCETSYIILNTVEEVERKQEELYYILKEYHVHFLSHTHVCDKEGQQGNLHLIFSGQHPSIKIIYIRNELLSAINAVHRVFAKGRAVTTVCPVCGNDTF